MNTLAGLLPPGIVHVLGHTLLHFVWQGAAIAAVLALALPLLRRRAAEVRYAAACAALFAMAVAPIVTFALLTADPAPAGSLLLGFPIGATPSASSPMRSAHWAPQLSHLVVAWLACVIVLGTRLTAGWLHLLRLRRSATRSLPRAWAERAEHLARRLGVRAAFRVVASTAAAVPSVIGILRPVVLIPASVLTGLPPGQLEVVLAHELAHVRRLDFLVNLLQTAVEMLLFYHPGVWWVSSRIRREREYCCDDLAAEVTGDRIVVARALAELETLRGAMVPHGVSATGGSLMDRVRRLLNTPSNDRRYGSGWMVPLALFLGLAAVGSSAVDAVAAPQEDPAGSGEGVKTIVLHIDGDGDLVMPGEHHSGAFPGHLSKDEEDRGEIRIVIATGKDDSSKASRHRRRSKKTSGDGFCEHCGAPLRPRASRSRRGGARHGGTREAILEFRGDDGERIVRRIRLDGDDDDLVPSSLGEDREDRGGGEEKACRRNRHHLTMHGQDSRKLHPRHPGRARLRASHLDLDLEEMSELDLGEPLKLRIEFHPEISLERVMRREGREAERHRYQVGGGDGDDGDDGAHTIILNGHTIILRKLRGEPGETFEVEVEGEAEGGGEAETAPAPDDGDEEIPI